MEEKNKLNTAIVFDFGGVLIDWNPYLLYRTMLDSDEEIQQFLNEIGFRDWNLSLDKGKPFAQGVEELSAKFPHRAELIRAFDTRWMETLGEPLLDTVAVMQKIKTAGYPLYGLSNWSAEKFRLVKQRFEFLNYLDDYVVSGEVKQIKPESDIFNTLLSRIHRSAGECLFIDDSQDNIRAADNLGFQTILFTSADQLETELKRMKILAG